MANLPELPKVRLRGPFWSADAEVIKLADPRQHHALRALFVDITPRSAVGQTNVLLPGTLLALCFVTGVAISPTSSASYTWKRTSGTKPEGKLAPSAISAALASGQLALLLLQADSGSWPAKSSGKLPEFTVLAGDISLDMLQPQGKADDNLYRALRLTSAAPADREGPSRLLGTLTVHGSGLSIFGRTTMPWDRDTDTITAPFLLARRMPDVQSPGGGPTIPGFRLAIETERLTENEVKSLIDSWRRFNRFINPRHPINGISKPPETPSWVTLEVANPLVVPRLHWDIVPWQTAPDNLPLQIERGELTVLISDQQPYDGETPPESLALIVPGDTTVTRVSGGGLRLATATGEASGASGSLSYTAAKTDSRWTEQIGVTALELAYSPIEALKQLRTSLDEPEPTWESGDAPLDPPVLWGITPLADGWAQIPFPNLTEDIYLEAQAANLSSAVSPTGIVQGAVVFGNAVQGRRPPVAQQPWSLTISSARMMEGTWELARAGDDYALTHVTLTLHGLDTFVDGLLWLAADQPSAADALPSYDNWVAGLFSLPLQTATPDGQLYPPLLTLALQTLNFTIQTPASTTDPPPYAALQDWSYEYRLATETFKKLVAAGVFAPDALGEPPPLIWRRHPTLPMVQALPLTQTLSPPSYPSCNRQLAPFQAAVAPDAADAAILAPSGWRFGVDVAGGATTWPRFQGSLTPAREWLLWDPAKVADDGIEPDPDAPKIPTPLFDLPLAALSLPGLVLDPRPEGEGLGAETATRLTLQYRYDLPYADELEALAQLPKTPRNPKDVSPLPDSPRPEPQRPLTRATFGNHWRRLSERASLASADAVATFFQSDGHTVVRNLVEPSDWPVNATLDLKAYPGVLVIDNADPAHPAALKLEREASLRGLRGRFVNTTAGQIRLLSDSEPADNPYLVEAGGMAAHHETDGRYRDQRGLLRGATVRSGGMLRTSVVLTPGGAQVDLTTLMAGLELKIGASGSWEFWFRDLPVQGTTFRRDAVRSAKSQDANDPEALSRDFNYLEGYEWRLQPSPAPSAPADSLKLYGLDFYPLMLEQVTLNGDAVQGLQVIGRLQLPLGKARELTDFASTVRLTFSAAAGWALALTSVARVGEVGEWPLTLQGGEAAGDPRLLWSTISLGPDRLVVSDARLNFFLFGVEWSAPLSSLMFTGSGAVAPAPTIFPDPGADVRFAPRQLALQLDPASGTHSATLTLGVRFGGRPALGGLQALYTFHEGRSTASGPELNVVHDVSGADDPLDLRIDDMKEVRWTTDGLLVEGTTFIASSGPATRLIEAIRASNALTVEAWITPTKPDADARGRIVTISTDQEHRNFMLQQGADDKSDLYLTRLRTFTPDGKDRQLTVQSPGESLKPRLTHLVYTRDAGGTGRLYLDGVERASDTLAGDCSRWNPNYPLVLAGERTDDHHFRGEYRQVAIYDRALTSAEISARFQAGPGAVPNAGRQAFAAEVEYQLLEKGAGAVTWTAGRLFDDVNLDRTSSAENPAILSSDDALQFRWRTFVPEPDRPLRVLPGVPLNGPLGDDSSDPAHQAPGFAVLSFAVVPKAGDVPELRLETAFVEALLFATWGDPLQRTFPARSGDQEPALVAARRQVFGSSAGELALGYTGQLKGTGWDESFVLNGYLELKNLISWPQAMVYDDAQARLTLPAARPGGSTPALNHYRHTLRVLFNQHAIPPTILSDGDGTLLFNFAPGASWQFLAVAEHQIVQVQSREQDRFSLTTDTRWTTVQEVRLLAPDTLAQALRALASAQTVEPIKGIDDLEDASDDLFGKELRTLLSDATSGELRKLSSDTLLVEASAAHWIRQRPVVASGATTLQFLPAGSQLATLSGPHDYVPSDPQTPEWLLLATPFLGRLQNATADALDLDAAASTGLSPLQIDPVLLIERRRTSAPAQALPALALALSSWGDSATVTVNLSSFDTAVGRTWSRLDPIALEESWFRLQHPRREPEPAELQSVIAALPDTPARLSRSVALRWAFDPRLANYPPQDSGSTALEEPGGAQLIWRERSLLLTEAVVGITPTTSAPYGWIAAGALFLSSRLFTPKQDGQGRNLPPPWRYAAATAQPAALNVAGQPNPEPLSLAVSPYLGLEWRPGIRSDDPRLVAHDLQVTPRIVVAELLCIDPRSRALAPIAAHVWELDGERWTSANVGQASQDWARETHTRIAPTSPLAVLRFRVVNDNPLLHLRDTSGVLVPLDDTAPLTTGYDFALVSGVVAPRRLARRVFRMRAAPDALQFREGQCSHGSIPRDIRDVEAVPPQVIGVQPLYLTERPLLPTERPEDATTAEGKKLAWPWGVSALRTSVRYTEGGAGVVGSLGLAGKDVVGEAADGAALTLWWQAVQQIVQYRSALRDGRPSAGLPPRFRAPAIKSLLPVMPDLPLPAIARELLTDEPIGGAGGDEPAPATTQTTFLRWQPVLPGAVRYLLSGARAGVPFALRAQLLRQSGLSFTPADSKPQIGQGMLSGSVPVQHRAPRPVPLPANDAERRDVALRTWASHFGPTADHLLSDTPVDEAFLAEFRTEGTSKPARRLRLRLLTPYRGAVSGSWDGTLEFETLAEGDADDSNWNVRLELTEGGRTFVFAREDESRTRYVLQKQIIPQFTIEFTWPFGFRIIPLPPKEVDLLPDLRAMVAAKAPGAPLLLMGRATYTPDGDGFVQTLAFTLRRVADDVPPLPLEPRFIHFEDPEYNRCLTSAAASVSRSVRTEEDGKRLTHSVTLAADRREYNVDSPATLRYDWDDPRYVSKAELQIRRIDPESGIPEQLELAKPDTSNSESGKIIQLSLADLKQTLSPGDVLEFQLTIAAGPLAIKDAPPGATASVSADTPIILRVTIVAEPVIPVPQAAYALLRRQTIAGQEQVECVRFAWSPAASRVELVCPDDLRTEVVRRRAVFHLADSPRPQTAIGYAVQKITQTGSTYIPMGWQTLKSNQG